MGVDRSFWELIRSDVTARIGGRTPRIKDWLFHLGTLTGAATTLHRLAHAAGRVHPVLGSIIQRINHYVTRSHINWRAEIGFSLLMFHPNNVTIGQVKIGDNFRVQQDVIIGGAGGDTYDANAVPTIGNDVFVGAGARIFGACEIGDGAKVGANAVVFKNVPAGATAVGVPARIITRPGIERPESDSAN